MATRGASADRRRSGRRKRAGELIVFTWEDPQGVRGTARGKLMDISTGGLACRTEGNAVPVGAEGTVTIHFEAVQIVCPAVAVRSLPNGVAVRFLDVASGDVDQLERLQDQP